jgi:hypothetical protein
MPLRDADHGDKGLRAVRLQSPGARGWSLSQKRQETHMTNENRELNIAELDNVSGGDMALNLAIKAYEALGKRLVDAVHQPVTSPPTMSLHMR